MKMLDELLNRILELSQSGGVKSELQAALAEIRQLVQNYLSQDLLMLVRKVATRLNTTVFDDEITLLISAAQDDLVRQGVDSGLVRAAEKPLVRLAITTYCKARFGLDNPDSEKYGRAYQSLADELRKSTGYMSGGAST